MFGVIYYLYRADLADLSREMCNIHLLNGAHLDNWLLIFTAREQGCANDLFNMLAVAHVAAILAVSSS